MTSRWGAAKLGEVCDVRRGSVITEKTTRPGDVPVIAGGIGPAYFHDTPNRGPNVVTVSGSGANAGFVNFFDRPIWASDCSTIEPKNDNLNVHYVHRFLLSAQRFINENLRQGAAQPHVYPKDLAQLEIPLPPIDEQQRIVAVLDKAFAAVDRARTLAEANLADSSEILANYIDALTTGATADEREIGEICELHQGLAINKKSKHLLVENSSLPLLRIKDLRDGTHEQYVAETGFPKNAKVNRGDIIYTRTGQVGFVFRNREGVIHNNCFKITPLDGVDRNYLFWAIQGKKFKERVTALAQRAAQPDITHKIFKAQLLFVPSAQQQIAAAKKIENMAVNSRQLDASYHAKLQDFSDLRQSLLLKAFSGALT